MSPLLRPRALLSTVGALSLASVGAAAGAHASPSQEGASGSCSFVLTPPQVVQVSTTRMVLATLKPGPCTMDAVPNDSVVCLSIKGDDAPEQCSHKAGSATALIYYPYRPGAAYVVTGQGCADLYEDPVSHSTTGPVHKICQSFGPTSFTL
jgi:hypothetical protein